VLSFEILASPNSLCSSAKSALHGLIHWLSQTYSSKGITVNGVAPALIQNTSILPGSVEALAKSKSHILLHKQANRGIEIPIGRLGYPEEIAETVLLMVKNSYLTNKVYALDGGLFVQ